MPYSTVRDAVSIFYEFVLPDDQNTVTNQTLAVVTLGGRKGVKASKSLAQVLANTLHVTVLIWDRRNSHESGFHLGTGPLILEDVEDLYALISNVFPANQSIILVGSSSGARVSTILCLRHPSLSVRGLVLAPPTGGDAVKSLQEMYYLEPIRNAFSKGLESVLLLDDYKDLCATSKASLLSCSREDFVRSMDVSSKWIQQFERSVFLGVTDAELKSLPKIVPNILIVHDGFMEDSLHSPKTALGLARALGVRTVFVIPGILGKSKMAQQELANLVKQYNFTQRSNL